jgi:hypothetical protein
VLVLRKPLNKVKWFAILLLTNGAVQYQLSGGGCDSSGGALKTSVEGLVVMAVIIVCAAGGNVATQMVMQASADQPLMLQNSLLYGWGVLLNGFNWWYSVEVNGAAWFGNFSGRAFFLCCFRFGIGFEATLAIVFVFVCVVPPALVCYE